MRIFTGEGFAGDAVCIPNGGTIEDAAGTPFDDRVRSNLWVGLC